MNSTKNIYKVSEINNIAGKVLEKNFRSIWVEGEISNFSQPSSGHMYFTIKDEKASIDAVMFRGVNRKLNFKPKRGMKVTVRGNLGIFARSGRYQIKVWEMLNKGEGELEKKFLKLKKDLKEEGLFKNEHKTKLPTLPRKIGVVTSPTGAAIKDIINVVRRRFAGVELLIYPVRVQGKEAAKEITHALNRLNEKRRDIDVIIVGRGGGALEDIWPFNREIVGRAIFNSEIPVISAVGHEVDFTISDFVADLRAPTPSAAAELVVKNKAELIRRLARANKLIHKSLVHKIKTLTRRLERVSKENIYQVPEVIVEKKLQEFDYISENLSREINRAIDEKTHKFDKIKTNMETLSPRATLKRGYSFTQREKSDNIIKKSADLNEGEIVKTYFYSGSIKSKIKDVDINTEREWLKGN
ncbi:MAG: exodeoxyribonuclease VII large subunit [Elusimicrobiota bacterium]